MRRVGSLTAAVVALLLLGLVVGVPASRAASRTADPGRAEDSLSPQAAAHPTDAELDAIVAEGGALYAANCAVCHGATGGGIEEARLAFPTTHRHCTRCHKPNNRVVMPLSQMTADNDMFSLGTPPPLQGAGMAATVPADALFAYVRTTMPRYEPGRLSDGAYWKIVAFLADLNQRDDATAEAVAAAVASEE